MTQNYVLGNSRPFSFIYKKYTLLLKQFILQLQQGKIPIRQFQTICKETLGTNFRPVHHFAVTKSVTFQKLSGHKMAADLRRVRHRRFRYLAVHSKLAFVATLLLALEDQMLAAPVSHDWIGEETSTFCVLSVHSDVATPLLLSPSPCALQLKHQRGAKVEFDRYS